MKNPNQQSIITYIFINIALSFSFALPAAGMLNHLVAGEASVMRGLVIWLILSAVCFLLTLPLVPVIRRRLDQRDTISGQEQGHKTEVVQNQRSSQEA